MTEKEGMKGIGVGLLDLYDTKLCLQFFLLLFLQAFFFFFSWDLHIFISSVGSLTVTALIVFDCLIVFK